MKTETKHKYIRKAFGERPPYLKTLRMYLPMYTWGKERATIEVDGFTIKNWWRGTSKSKTAKNVIIYQNKKGHYYVRSLPDRTDLEWQKWAHMKGVGKLKRPPQVTTPQQKEMDLQPPAEGTNKERKVADLKERNRELQATLARCFVWIQEKSADVKLLQEVKSCIQG